jgi:cytochrome P450
VGDRPRAEKEGSMLESPVTPRPYSEVPRANALKLVARAIMSGGGRFGMRENFQDLYRECGPIATQGIGGFRMVYLFGPDANRTVLLDRGQNFSARRPWMGIMGKIFPDGLLLLDGETHKSHRKIMRQAFKRPVLRDYATRMGPMIEASLASWPADGEMLAFQALKSMTLDIAVAIFLGAELGDEADRMNESFEGMVAASMPGGLRLPLPGLEYNQGLKGREYMLRYLGRLLPAKRADQLPDMLSRMCHAETEEGERFADSEILDHMAFLMMAAHDTTTSTLTSLLYELARHPEWQERIREESFAIGSEAPGFDDMERLDSLTWAMRETLRLYPPLPVIPRIANEAFEFGGFEIPADSLVAVSPIFTHYMEEWWDAPCRFDPLRFSPERAEDQRHTHSWIPFGGGAHMCIGRLFAETQVRLVIHHLVRRFRWTVPVGYRMPVQQAPISKPRDGLPIRLTAIS